MRRPSAVGSRSRVTAQGERVRHIETRLAGRPPQTRDERIAVDARFIAETLAVDARGDAVRLALEIEQFVATTPGGSEVLLRPGERVIVEVAAPPARGTISIGGSSVSARVREHLELVVSTERSETDSDLVFGFRGHRRRPGERWPIDAARMAADGARRFPGLDARSIQGQVVFHSVAHQGGDELYDVGCDSRMQLPSIPNAPAGTRLQSAEARVRMRWLVSARGQPVIRRADDELAIHGVFSAPTPAGVVDATITSTSVRHLTYAAP
jgi:hypothetical protein